MRMFCSEMMWARMCLICIVKIKVIKFQNEFMKLLFVPKYEHPVLCYTTGQKSLQVSFIFCEKR